MTTRDTAQELQKLGYTYAEIGEECGVSSTTVYRWLNPEAAARDRAERLRWKREHREQKKAADMAYVRRLDIRGTCVECGDPMGIGHKPDGVCKVCRARHKQEAWDHLEALWAEGASFPMIMAALGWSKGRVSVELFRAREAGRKLPHRYTMRDGKRVA